MMNIPLCIPSIGEEDIKAVVDVLRSGWLAHGPKTKEFEESFARYIGVKHAISLNSCTSALQLAVLANNIKGEIILPSFTFSASANSIVTSDAKPVFCDIEYGTCNIDVEKMKELITPKTQAIMPVHFAGQSCEMKAIMEIAEDKKLIVIEDSAECIGGTYKMGSLEDVENGTAPEKKTGSFGIGCFSFYPTKNITTGEGGMLTTNDDRLANKFKALKAHGIESSTFEREKLEKPWLRAATYAGFNFRLCDINSALGNVQLKKVDDMNRLRIEHSHYLDRKLKHEKIALPVESRRCKHVYQMYTIKLDKSVDRSMFLKKMKEKGVGASVHFDPPVHKQPFYHNIGWKKGSLPVTEEVAETIVTLPMYPQLTKEQMDYMVECVMNALQAKE